MTALRVHLKDEQQIIFDLEREAEAMERGKQTELTAWFDFNSQSLAEGVQVDNLPKYIDMPKEHTFNLSSKQWAKRKQSSATIGRIHSVNPVAGKISFFYVSL